MLLAELGDRAHKVIADISARKAGSVFCVSGCSAGL
jgi:hypothetical protein